MTACTVTTPDKNAQPCAAVHVQTNFTTFQKSPASHTAGSVFSGTHWIG